MRQIRCDPTFPWFIFPLISCVKAVFIKKFGPSVPSQSYSGLIQKKTSVFLKMPAPAHGYNSQPKTFSKRRQEIENFPNNTPDSTGG